MSDDLIIKISADNKDLKSAYDDIKAQTEDLEGKLGNIAKISGVAFAALSGQVGIALHAFGEMQSATRTLTDAMQNQGIFTTELRDNYKDYADEVQNLTGIQADEVMKAQAVAQSFIGQVPVTKQLTQAIADLAVKQGISLPEAAGMLGKAIGSGTGMLLRMGIQFADTDTEAQRYQKTLDFVALKAGGFAAAANQGVGSIKGLEAAFHSTQEELGARFAPAFTFVVQKLTEFLTPSKDSTGAMVDLKAALIAVGLVITGIGVAVPVMAQAFLTVRAAALALNVTLGATKIALMGLGIGLVIVALTELVLHWDTVSTRVMAIVKGLTQFISGSFSGLGKIISGAFHLDTAQIKEGLLQIQEAFAQGAKTAVAEIPKETEKALEKQDTIKKVFADKAAKQQAEADSIRRQLGKAENEAILMDLEGAAQSQIDLKKQEIETLKALEQKHSQEQKELLKERLAALRELEVENNAQEKERNAAFEKTEDAAQKELDAKRVKYRVDFTKKEQADIKKTQLTEKEAQKKVYADALKEEIAAHNTFLVEQARYGTAYAAINQVMHSSEVQGLKSATGELVQLTQSKNETLKGIGKAASVAQIIIKTGESAMNVYAGFSTIPIVGPALGIAAAAATIAFGAEQIGNVMSAQAGGLVGGSGYGDHVPALLEPGELVVPRQNFSDVVSSYSQSQGSNSEEGGAPYANVKLTLDGDLGKLVETKILERQRIGISLFKTKLS